MKRNKTSELKTKRAKARRAKKLATVFLSLALCLITVALLWVSADKADAYQPKPACYKSICLETGDTLWGIAEEYCPEGKDIREYIHETMELNGLKTSEIHAGCYLVVPVYGPMDETIE